MPVGSKPTTPPAFRCLPTHSSSLAWGICSTSKVCVLSERPGTACGPVQGANEPPSMLHSNVEPASEEPKVKLGVPFDGSAGLIRMVVFGAVRSTSTLRIALAA